MSPFEPETDVMTRHEIYQRLNAAQSVVTTEGVGEAVRGDTWKYIDFLLDTLLDLDYIETGDGRLV